MNESLHSIKDIISNIEDVDYVGVSAMVCLYMVMLLIGGWATWHQYKNKSKHETTQSEELYLAGRRLGLPVAVATLAATEVGGAFLAGTTEEIFKNGILWCTAPFGYIAGFIINGMTFGRTMRRRGYITVFDPLQESFGKLMGGLCVIPHIIGDFFWIGAVLSVLGSTMNVTMGLDRTTSILLSSAVGILYTLTGGMLSVAYTDILQIVLVFVGMFSSLAFVLTSDVVAHESQQWTLSDWLGTVPAEKAGKYADIVLIPLLGGLSWQGYYQRALSLESEKHVLPMSLLACFLPMVLLVPPIVIGGVAKTTDWNATALGVPISPGDASIVLPLTLRYLVPRAVSFFGVAAITAAVMSTIDSAVLGTSSIITNNIYKGLLRTKASEVEMIWCSRISILVVGVAATGMAFTTESIYGLWYLSSDLMYVLVFPHFVMANVAPRLGTAFASGASFVVCVVLRLLVGEEILGLPSVLKFPETVPVRTLVMAISFFVLISVSFIDKKYRSRKGGSVTKYDLGSELGTLGLLTMKSRSFKQSIRSPSHGTPKELEKRNEEKGSGVFKISRRSLEPSICSPHKVSNGLEKRSESETST